MNALWTCTYTYSICLYNLLWFLNLHNQWSWVFHSHTQLSACASNPTGDQITCIVILHDVMQSCSTAFLCGRMLLGASNTSWRVFSMKRLQANYLCSKCIINYMQVVFHTHNYYNIVQRPSASESTSAVINVYVSRNLGICVNSRLRQAFSESGNCVPISRLCTRGNYTISRLCNSHWEPRLSFGIPYFGAERM